MCEVRILQLFIISSLISCMPIVHIVCFFFFRYLCAIDSQSISREIMFDDVLRRRLNHISLMKLHIWHHIYENGLQVEEEEKKTHKKPFFIYNYLYVENVYHCFWLYYVVITCFAFNVRGRVVQLEFG